MYRRAQYPSRAMEPPSRFESQVSRVWNALAYGTHTFFQENGFVWLSSPIITASDCEGAGVLVYLITLFLSQIPNYSEATDSPVKAIPTTNDGLVKRRKSSIELIPRVYGNQGHTFLAFSIVSTKVNRWRANEHAIYQSLLVHYFTDCSGGD
ncbi:hypothetical protein ACS0TY_034747 [Phlomoides rotata]